METRSHKVYLGLSVPNETITVDPDDAIEFVSEYLSYYYAIDGFTVNKQVGYWQGGREDVLVFEVIDDNSIPWEGLTDLGNKLKQRFNQESVLVTKQSITAEFV